MSSSELDSQLRAVGVNKEQRKRLIAAARLGGIPNPLKQLGLREPSSGERRSRSRSPHRAAAWQAALEAPPPPATSGALPLAVAPGAGQRLVRAPSARPAPRAGPAKEEDDPDLDSFLAGGRAIMAKAKAMGQARRERVAREQLEVERQQQREQEEAMVIERERQEQERRRQEEERARQEEERRREERRRARREEKLRRKEQKKRQRAEEEEELEDEDTADEEPEDDEAERRRRQQAPAKGFFSQAFKGNQQQRALWSEPIKGHVSNNYKGTSDADLERRFRLIGAGAQSAGEKLMTEEEVLAMLRNRKSKGGR
mmetsp:Transcript_54651/g.151618  ORF Transcript_54651/g.151618 Transcript_54651/m.151618 type:complete len:314 (-) Transcript_54651:1-942(-)